jgi:hypothetical protein
MHDASSKNKNATRGGVLVGFTKAALVVDAHELASCLLPRFSPALYVQRLADQSVMIAPEAMVLRHRLNPPNHASLARIGR